jgi:hypothetical protein
MLQLICSTIQENQNVYHNLFSETGKQLQENYFYVHFFSGNQIIPEI